MWGVLIEIDPQCLSLIFLQRLAFEIKTLVVVLKKHYYITLPSVLTIRVYLQF